MLEQVQKCYIDVRILFSSTGSQHRDAILVTESTTTTKHHQMLLKLRSSHM